MPPYLTCSCFGPKPSRCRLEPRTLLHSARRPGRFLRHDALDGRARRGQTVSTPQSDRALEELCQSYWFPLYAYVRRRGHSKEDAEDLTQAFFARFLEKNYLEGLDAERGRFRAFLLASLKHFLRMNGTSRRRKNAAAAEHLFTRLANRRYPIPGRRRQ